jgi:hypothetical protein
MNPPITLSFIASTVDVGPWGFFGCCSAVAGVFALMGCFLWWFVKNEPKHQAALLCRLGYWWFFTLTMLMICVGAYFAFVH